LWKDIWCLLIDDSRLDVHRVWWFICYECWFSNNIFVLISLTAHYHYSSYRGFVWIDVDLAATKKKLCLVQWFKSWCKFERAFFHVCIVSDKFQISIQQFINGIVSQLVPQIYLSTFCCLIQFTTEYRSWLLLVIFYCNFSTVLPIFLYILSRSVILGSQYTVFYIQVQEPPVNQI